MLKTLTVAIVVLSITTILAVLAAYWLIIAYIDVQAQKVSVTATVPRLEVRNCETRTLKVKPTTGKPATNQEARLQGSYDFR